MSLRPTQSPFRTVRLPEAEANALLDRLDSASVRQPDVAAGEYRYRSHTCVVNLAHPGSGSPVAFVCTTRQISDKQLWFLHGGYVHAGTRCVAQLISAHGAWQHVLGAVVSCKYVEGSVHEVVVRFDESIDPGLYCPEALRVRVLLVEDDPLMTRLACATLKSLNAIVTHAENGKVAVERALADSYGVIFMDVEMPVLDGLSAARQLRAEGYDGMIVAATAKTRPQDQQACIEAGCDRFVAKPYARRDFEQVLIAARTEPIYSSIASDASLAELITDFVDGLPAYVTTLKAAYRDARLTELETLVRALKATSGGLGFEPICHAAATMEDALQANKPQQALAGYMGELARMARLARAPSSR